MNFGMSPRSSELPAVSPNFTSLFAKQVKLSFFGGINKDPFHVFWLMSSSAVDNSTEVAKLVQSTCLRLLEIEEIYLSQIYIPIHAN